MTLLRLFHGIRPFLVTILCLASATDLTPTPAPELGLRDNVASLVGYVYTFGECGLS